jgi:hypothetical protein
LNGMSVSSHSEDLMLNRVKHILLVACIGLIGADRIDLLAGKASFKLTPFLVCAVVIVGLQVLRGGLSGTTTFITTAPMRRQMPFVLCLVLFLSLAGLSTIFGIDPERSLMALADLCLVSLLGYCVSVLILTNKKPSALILQSISFGLIVYFLFCIGESIAWSNGIIQGSENPGSWLETTFAAKTLFWIPRLSGPTIDANRSGFILVMYLALLDQFVPRSRYASFLRFLIAVFIILAFSRSAMLCWFVYWLLSKASTTRLASSRGIAWLSVIVLLFAFVVGEYHEQIVNLLDAWQVSDIVSDRLSGEAGTSGGDHLQLIERGYETWASSPHNMVAGIGLATAPHVLGDFFGDDKYGNFHCLYATVLAELGLPAFVVLLIILMYPLISRAGTSSAIAAIMVFNAPYQSHMEPIFWLVLALVWSRSYRLRNPAQAVARRALASA